MRLLQRLSTTMVGSPFCFPSESWKRVLMLYAIMVSRCTRSTKSTGPTSEQFLQQFSIVAAMLLGATLDQVIAAEWAGEGNSTYMDRAHY